MDAVPTVEPTEVPLPLLDVVLAADVLDPDSELKPPPVELACPVLDDVVALADAPPPVGSEKQPKSIVEAAHTPNAQS